jgi:hypothetical protein
MVVRTEWATLVEGADPLAWAAPLWAMVSEKRLGAVGGRALREAAKVARCYAEVPTTGMRGALLPLLARIGCRLDRWRTPRDCARVLTAFALTFSAN